MELKTRSTKELVEEVEETTEEGIEQDERGLVNWNNVLSTGSTLLDLAITGKSVKGGGIPGGILVEIVGPSGWGKTTLLSEICVSAQRKGGFALIGDAERRLNEAFIKRMGIRITEENYRQPKSVSEVKDLILNTPETGDGILDVTGIDSIASLLSELDQEEGGDKRGSAKAKELHQMCRLVKMEVAKKNRLVVFTNQIQDNQTTNPYAPKERVPGGNAVPFYSSLRMRIGPSSPSHIKDTVMYKGHKIEKVIGINSEVYVFKSTIDDPFRRADVPIIFDYGIDDIRANLEYYKTMTGSKGSFPTPDGKSFKAVEDAIVWVEKEKLEKKLRKEIIDIWIDVESKFKVDRRSKVRF